MGKMSKKLEKTYNKVGKHDGKILHEGAEKLEMRKSELLLEAEELRLRIADLGAEKEHLSEKLNHCLTKIVLCDKMIENFGLNLNLTKKEFIRREKEKFEDGKNEVRREYGAGQGAKTGAE